MKKDRRYGQSWKIALVFTAIFAWVAIPFFMQDKVSAAGDSVPILVRTANLVSPTGSVNPHGAAEYQLYADGNRELEIEIEDVNLPNGTVMSFFVDGNAVGTMALNLQKARLKLRTEDGQTVPVTVDGSTVQVRNGSTILVAGVLGGGGPNPSPSPSASPSASPTGSPNPSPTASPTGTPTGTPSPSPTGSPNPSPSPTGSPNESEIYAILNGATINGVLPRGLAEYEIHSSRTELEVRVYQVNLPSGTVLNVSVNNAAVGNLTVSGGEGRLRLRSDNGDNVPVVTAGTTIALKNGANTVLSGTFTTTTSPSPTPTGTPQGRYFEGHLNGAGLTPPVTTNAIGEIKVLLNAAETQATITGEFNRFTSAQTSALIQVTVAGTTTTIANLGAIPSPEGEGHFPATTVNVTAQQVQLLRMGSWTAIIGSANNPNGEIAGRILNDSHSADFDGDGRNDLAVFRPSTGAWYSQNSQGFSAQILGSANDKIVSADFDGDGRTDAAVFKNVNNFGIWEVKRSSDGGTTTAQFGLGDDIPVRGDFDGDGRNDLAVFRPSNGVWYVQKSDNTGYQIVQFGIAADRPMPADMDGDGKDDIVVFRQTTGDWYWLNSRTGTFGGAHFGSPNDVPVTGDFDGDGRNDLTVFRPSTGAWYTLRSSDGVFQGVAWGLSDDVPVAGNYDGDNKTDIAVFRRSTGFWYILRSSDGTFQSAAFGTAGDQPVGVQ